ncbi:ABC transporter permease [Bacteroidota bacterium]
MQTSEITWINLAIGSLVILIPLTIFYYYKTGLVKPMSVAFLRMAVQLTLVGVYLKYIFEYNALWLNILWVIVMAFAAAYTVVKRSELTQNKFYLPVISGIFANILLNGALVAFIIIGSDQFFNARYIIPIMGMFIGNSLNGTIIGLRSFYKALSIDEERYRYYLMCGAGKNEALFPFIGEALKDAFSPTIASTATIGLIWLPGMMTGQILGGSDPVTSIKYQIMIIVGIFAGTVISVFVSLTMSKRFVFDKYDLFDKTVLLSNTKSQK